MQYKDYYGIMGLSRNASADEIKQAYRRLARKYHPDVSKEKDAEQRFKEMNEAYEVLKDTEKRQAYDQLGNHWRSGEEEFRPSSNRGKQTGFRQSSEQDVNFSDFFESLFGGADREQGLHSRNSQEAAAPNTKITVTLEEAYNGTQRQMQIQATEADRWGQMVSTTRTINVCIPSGILAGQKIRLTNVGSRDFAGKHGDLYLEVEFKPHHYFRAEGRDIHLMLPVTPWEVALGCNVKVPTLGGKVDLKIPPGSQGGQQLRLRGRGFPGKPPGDQYVTLQIVTPPASNAAAEAIYQHMAQEMPMDPRAAFAD